MSLDHSAQSGRAPLAVRKDDLYETPPEAVGGIMDATTERPVSIGLFARGFEDRPPVPIEPTPSPYRKTANARAEFADMIRARAPRKRPQIGAYELADLDAAFQRCRFPTGDGPFLFCGAAIAANCYCAEHARLCYRRG